MRLRVDGRLADFSRLAAALSAALALGACAASGPSAGPATELALSPYGPQADYPVIVGEPYTVAGTTYTPEDVLNYDQIGFVSADAAGGAGVTGAHHTLPLPSYVEVTSLETGRTIVVRIERRGPMDGNDLIALSPGALQQLGASAGTPVRVRRVNPPEEQRALLRAGQPAEPRMDTPMPLVEVLKRKLPSGGTTPVALAPSSSSPAGAQQVGAGLEGRGPAPMLPPLDREETATAALAENAASAPPAQRPTASRGAFVVQAAAFSTAERAQRAARVLDAEVTQAGRYFRVRTGPFATRGEAEASLAKVRAAGYSDARILTNS